MNSVVFIYIYRYYDGWEVIKKPSDKLSNLEYIIAPDGVKLSWMIGKFSRWADLALLAAVGHKKEDTHKHYD